MDEITGSDLDQEYYICRPPQTIFDQRPINCTRIYDQLEAARKRKAIILVFAGRQIGNEYVRAVYGRRGHQESEITCGLYSFAGELNHMYSTNRVGELTRIAPSIEPEELKGLMGRYNRHFRYEATFVEHKKIPVNPLLHNYLAQLISFVVPETDTLGAVYVFPQLDTPIKVQFVSELCSTVLPAISPTLFPDLVQLNWLNDPAYQLPDEESIKARKQELEAEYAVKLEIINNELNANADKWRFLHYLITSQGDELVSALETYFRWLGFDQVENVDRVREERTGQFHEDLQVTTERGLLLVETKGISGRSTDRDCRQIASRRTYRVRELNRTDVFALYVANHERNLPPPQRTDPPFTQTQIEEAIDDQRGLCTTYELFKLARWINGGIVSVEDARNTLWDYGLISFAPSNATLIGRPQDILKQATVGIFDISNLDVSVGDVVILSKSGDYELATVISIQHDGVNVEKATTGIYGIQFDRVLRSSTEVWIRNQVKLENQS